ncbi:glycosyltransferase [bacterium]|nr:glycosyltransferase [bacterium]
MSEPLVYTVVVPTMNRPEELCKCLKLAIAQDPAPAELLVIDDGRLDEDALRSSLGKAAPPLRVERKERPGLVASLNIAGKLCRTPWLLALDDDIYLEAGYMRACQDAVDRHPDRARLAAIAGYPLLAGRSRTWRAAIRLAIERLFLLNGLAEGRFLPSSYFTDFECGRPHREPWAVEHVPGGLALWRTDVFRDLGYDPWFEGYAYGCDMELAYRATRQWEAICVPTARALHDKSPRSRVPNARMGELKVRNQRYFYRKHFAGSLLHFVCFHWALLGQVAMLTLAALTAPRSFGVRISEVAGMIAEICRPWPIVGGRS